MVKNRVSSIIVIFLCLSCFGRLYCDDFFKIKARIIEQAWKKIAFFYVSPKLTLDNFGYNSNINYYQPLAKPDWTADLGLKLQVSAVLGNRFIISIEENPSYLFYAEEVDRRAFNNSLSSTLFTYLGKINLKFQFDNSYIKGRPTSEFGPHTRLRTLESLISLDYGRHDTFFITLYANVAKTGHDEENYLGIYNLKHTLDRQELKTGIKLNKIIFSRTLLILNYEYVEYEFDYDIDKNGISSQASLGIEFPEISSIKGSLQFGLKVFRPSNPLYRDYTIPFGSGKVTLNLFKRAKFHLEYLVDNFYSFWQNDQQYNEKSAQAGIEYYLTRNIKLGYSYYLARLSYENLTDGEQTRVDNLYSSSFSIGVKALKNYGIGLEYRIYRADSTVPDFSRSSDFIGGYIIHEF